MQSKHWGSHNTLQTLQLLALAFPFQFHRHIHPYLEKQKLSEPESFRRYQMPHLLLALGLFRDTWKSWLRFLFESISPGD